MREFRSHRVQRLCTEYLKMMMISHFSNNKLICYLRKREENFDYYYGKIILRGEKIFSSMTQNNAVINSWVMVKMKKLIQEFKNKTIYNHLSKSSVINANLYFFTPRYFRKTSS